MHDIVEFLRRHPPFDDLEDETLEELSRTTEVEYFAAGTTIFRQGEGPMTHVRVIRRGTIELVDGGRVLDLLGEGELFGHPSMLSGLQTWFEARAGEDALTYRLPADAVVPLLSRPAGLRYVARSLLDRPRPDEVATGPTLDPARRPVAELVHGEPVISNPDSSVRDVAQRMAEEEVGAALVRLEDGELGIVTDRDLRDRVVAGGVTADAPVTEIMTTPVFTVTPAQPGGEVMLEMLDRDMHHVPVVWPHGKVLGILNDRDLLAAEARGPFMLRRAIDEAADFDELRREAAKLRPEVIALHKAGVAPARIGSIIAVVVDAITRRLIELTIEDLGPVACPLSWLALGSLGRREVVPSSDVDSALVWDGEGEKCERYMQTLGARVVGELAITGFAADPYGATAATPLFDRSFDSWRSLMRDLIEHSDRDKALVFISLAADARPVYELGVTRDPLEELGQVWHRRSLMRLMLRLALGHRPPRGLKRGKIDVKEDGLLPVTAIARYAGLAAGARLTSTEERLDYAATAGTLDGGDARMLKEAFELFWRLRLDHQVEQMEEGGEPDNEIDAEELNPVTRGYVREAFHAVHSVQRSLKNRLDLPL